MKRWMRDGMICQCGNKYHPGCRHADDCPWELCTGDCDCGVYGGMTEWKRWKNFDDAKEIKQLRPDPKLAGLTCPLCGVDRGMTYSPRTNARTKLGYTKVWECDSCPAVVFEKYSEEDAKAL